MFILFGNNDHKWDFWPCGLNGGFFCEPLLMSSSTLVMSNIKSVTKKSKQALAPACKMATRSLVVCFEKWRAGVHPVRSVGN